VQKLSSHLLTKLLLFACRSFRHTSSRRSMCRSFRHTSSRNYYYSLAEAFVTPPHEIIIIRWPHKLLWRYDHTIVPKFVTSLYCRCDYACCSALNSFDFIVLSLIVSVVTVPFLGIVSSFWGIVLSRTYFFDAWSVTARPQLTNNGPLKPYLLSEASWCKILSYKRHHEIATEFCG
jgi:hypothetical protein